jgi:DNA gyrase subunit A
MVTERGQSARFDVDILRTASRISGGVRGIKLPNGVKLASMDVVEPEAQLLVVTRNGYGKRTPLSAFPRKGRGIGGVRAFKTTAKTGPVQAARVVDGDEELMMISENGIVIRMAIDTISERTGRSTGGVILMRLDEGDSLAAIAILRPSVNGGDSDEPDDTEGMTLIAPVEDSAAEDDESDEVDEADDEGDEEEDEADDDEADDEHGDDAG